MTLEQFLRLFRFGTASATSFAINLGTTVFFHEVVGLSAEHSNAIAIVCAFLFNFAAWRYYITRPGQPRTASRQLIIYALSSVFFRGCEYTAFCSINALGMIDYRLLIFLITLSAMTAKFLWYQVVFGTPMGDRQLLNDQ